MSCKVIYTNDSSNKNQQTVLIDNSNTTQTSDNSPSTIIDTNPRGKSIFKIFTIMAAVVLGFILVYFMYYLMSPVIENKEVLLQGNENINDSGIIIYDSKNYNTTENFTRFMTSRTDNKSRDIKENDRVINTEGNDTGFISSETITVTPINQPEIYNHNNDEYNDKIITIGAFKPMESNITGTNTTREPVSSDESVLKQARLYSCLENVFFRVKVIHGDFDKCSISAIGERSKIRFTMGETRLFRCLITDGERCDRFLREEKKVHMDNGYNHLYYNFVMGDNGNLYKGRPLSCRTSEYESISDNPIIIGIPQCSKLDPTRYQKKYRFNVVLRKIMNCLENEDVLSDKFSVEFDKSCKYYLAEEFLRNYEKRITFLMDD